jgi:2,4-dienoyl-CoA reductase (NADPH2)
VLAGGAEEVVPEGALASSAVIASGSDAVAGAAHVVVADDGFGWWPAINVIELALAAGAARVTLVAPGTAFAGGIPPESRVQLLQRLVGAGELQVVPMCSVTEIAAGGVTLVERVSGRSRVLEADRVVVAGERRPRAAPDFRAPLALAIGDAVVPRRAAHAIAEGRAAAARVAAAVRAPQLS